jgi:uncharacterized protein (DUF2237 family)
MVSPHPSSTSTSSPRPSTITPSTHRKNILTPLPTVFDKPLYSHSTTPPTGFARDGFCRAPPEDKGNHSIAATVTDAFLDFSASRGNDLRKQAGLKAGQKWCLCAGRWKEAFDAAGGKVGDERVPKYVSFLFSSLLWFLLARTISAGR